MTWSQCKGKVILTVLDAHERETGKRWSFIRFTDGSESPRFDERVETEKPDIVSQLEQIFGMRR